MRTALLANSLIIGSALAAGLTRELAPELYHSIAQEDGPLEWASFWAFLLAAGAAGWLAFRTRARGRLPWCEAGLSLLCLFIAMEEISWGQRLLGYQPPSYFLEHNFQQELNLHNLVDTGLRKLALTVLILGYGVALPLLLRIAPLRALALRLGVIAPPVALVPAFLSTGLLYLWYPVHLTGEFVEFMLGAGLLFAVLAQRPGREPRVGDRPIRVGAAAALVAGLGWISAEAGSRSPSDPELVAQAQLEVRALTDDLEALAAAQGRGFVPRCGIHKRFYSFARKYGVPLPAGNFSAQSGDSDVRARYFLDPWNSPYWIRHKCQDGKHYAFVYSFGPDRRRNSSRTQVLGADIGALIDRAKSGGAPRRRSSS